MKYDDLERAFMFVNSGPQFDNVVYVSRSTGRTFWCSDAGDVDDLPEDVETSSDYIRVPHKNDLDLGQRLVWQFVMREIPGLEENVRGFFSARGAYGRYKSFLEEVGLLEKWYQFEDEMTKDALLKWCVENEIQTEG